MAVFWKLGERAVAFEPVDLGLGPTLPHTTVLADSRSHLGPAFSMC